MEAIAECDTSVCRAACCRFVTQYSPAETADTLKYLALHGVEYKRAEQGGYWLRFPVACSLLDPETLRCRDWENRPDVCKRYPQHESPFISVELCSQMQALKARLKASYPREIDEIFKEHWRW